ncbi:MAG: aminotransferase class I/II-fold pyridoxal phosphate-dependent enzyme [Firmicutes bacterium]|nr:aminotransferase class I/II-fold pyridoxal phosphate-dependent enzyme [Bacillota bacterium]
MRWNSLPESFLDREGLRLTGNFVRLHANELPFALPDVVRAVIVEEVAQRAQYYPDPSGMALKRALARRYGITPEQIVLGSGSGDIIEHVIRGLAQPPHGMIIPHPSFPLYEAVARSENAVIQRVPLYSDGCLDLASIAEAITTQTSLVILCNPNNPTGGYWPVEDIVSFLEDIPPEVAVLLDEAYWELTDTFAATGSGTETLLAAYDNLLISRTFSKYYGLAGLRIGYLLAANQHVAMEVQKRMSRAIPNRLALKGAEAALSAAAESTYQEYAKIIRNERERMVREIRGLNLLVYPTQTNFITVKWQDHQHIMDSVHIAIRSGHTMGLPGFSRITIGTPQNNDEVLRLIKTSVMARDANPLA